MHSCMQRGTCISNTSWSAVEQLKKNDGVFACARKQRTRLGASLDTRCQGGRGGLLAGAIDPWKTSRQPDGLTLDPSSTEASVLAAAVVTRESIREKKGGGAETEKTTIIA